MIYFTRNDDDLWEAIQKVPEGEQNHEMRKALKRYFLGEDSLRYETDPPILTEPARSTEPTPEVEPIKVETAEGKTKYKVKYEQEFLFTREALVEADSLLEARKKFHSGTTVSEEITNQQEMELRIIDIEKVSIQSNKKTAGA